MRALLLHAEVRRPTPVEHRPMLPSAQSRHSAPTGEPMLQISALQLAELLAGIARAQAAIVQGLESETGGIRSGRIIPAVQNVAHLRDHAQPTLVDLPVRLLLNSMGRVGPDPANIAKELERLIGGKADAGGEALDFSKPA